MSTASSPLMWASALSRASSKVFGRDLLKSLVRYLEVIAFMKPATLIFSSAPTYVRPFFLYLYMNSQRLSSSICFI
ncbi:hypothetical protein HanIR_Chr02g0066931 [Helianthus annuus]|nr:hypothetical protein HanIR_Chr02g0066931 [Helianthus annuus]